MSGQVPGRLGGVRAGGEVMGPACDILGPELIEDFHSLYPDSPLRTSGAVRQSRGPVMVPDGIP